MSFRGDGDVMVDALIKASQEQKCVSQEPLPGHGRDLIPFDFQANGTGSTSTSYNNNNNNVNDDETPLLVGVDPRLRAHQVCMPQVPLGGHAAAIAKLSNEAPLDPLSSSTHNDNANNSSSFSRGQQQKNNNNKNKTSSSTNNLNGKSNNKTTTMNNNQEPKYAGASFTNSPDPDAVPLPSFLKTIPGAAAAMARRDYHSQSPQIPINTIMNNGSSPPNGLLQNLFAGGSSSSQGMSPPPPPPPHLVVQHQTAPMSSGKALLGNLFTKPPQQQQQQQMQTPSILTSLFAGGRNSPILYRPDSTPQNYIPEANKDFQLMLSKLSNASSNNR
jgi:hypothetical protein